MRAARPCPHVHDARRTRAAAHPGGSTPPAERLQHSPGSRGSRPCAASGLRGRLTVACLRIKKRSINSTAGSPHVSSYKWPACASTSDLLTLTLRLYDCSNSTTACASTSGTRAREAGRRCLPPPPPSPPQPPSPRSPPPPPLLLLLLLPPPPSSSLLPPPFPPSSSSSSSSSSSCLLSTQGLLACSTYLPLGAPSLKMSPQSRFTPGASRLASCQMLASVNKAVKAHSAPGGDCSVPERRPGAGPSPASGAACR